jgi:hypothetical protein
MRLNISTLILPRHVSTEVEAAMTECLMYETERCGLVAPGHHCVEDSEVPASSYSASMSAAAAAAVAGARRATKSGASPGASTNNGDSSGSGGGGGGGGDSSQLVRSKSVLLRESLEEALVGALPLPLPPFPRTRQLCKAIRHQQPLPFFALRFWVQDAHSVWTLAVCRI